MTKAGEIEDPVPAIDDLERFAKALATRHEYCVEQALGIRVVDAATKAMCGGADWPDPPENLRSHLSHPWLQARLREHVANPGGFIDVGLASCDLLRSLPEERASIEAIAEECANRDISFGLALIRHLVRGDADQRAWLARIVERPRFVGTALEEMAQQNRPDPRVIRAAKTAMKHFTGGDRAHAEHWLTRLERAHILRGARLDAFLQGLAEQGIVATPDKKKLRKLPAAERTPECVLETLISPRATVDFPHATDADWDAARHQLGVSGDAPLHVIASGGDWCSVVVLTEPRAEWLRTQNVELYRVDPAS